MGLPGANNKEAWSVEDILSHLTAGFKVSTIVDVDAMYLQMLSALPPETLGRLIQELRDPVPVREELLQGRMGSRAAIPLQMSNVPPRMYRDPVGAPRA